MHRTRSNTGAVPMSISAAPAMPADEPLQRRRSALLARVARPPASLPAGRARSSSSTPASAAARRSWRASTAPAGKVTVTRARLRADVDGDDARDAAKAPLQRCERRRGVASDVEDQRLAPRLVAGALDRAHQRRPAAASAVVGDGRLLGREVDVGAVDARHLLQRPLDARDAGGAGHAADADGQRLRLVSFESRCFSCHRRRG